MRSTVAAAAAAFALSSCGARTGMLPEDAVAGAPDASAGEAGGVDDDPCPSAVAGPKAMERNCSTRDGRSRVPAPASPRIKWTSKLPTYGAAHLNATRLATDAADHAYVVTTSSVGDTGDVRRVRAADGSIDWTTTIAPDAATDRVPTLLGSGSMDLFAYSGSGHEAILVVDQSTGAATATTFGFDLYYAPGDPAVGADGSLYLTHSRAVGTAHQQTFVSRVRPGGVVAWTSPSLDTLLPVPSDTSVFPSSIALGRDGMVLVVVEAVASSGLTGTLLAFDPQSGASQSRLVGLGQVVGGPVVRGDGTILLLYPPAASSGVANLVAVAPDSQSSFVGLGVPATRLFGVTKDGVVIVGTTATDAGGVDGIAAIARDGATLWRSAPMEVRDATIAADGTIVTFGGKAIAALDATTGGTKWSLAAPSSGSYIGEVALTSSGAIVALEGDGTLFGAGD